MLQRLSLRRFAEILDIEGPASRTEGLCRPQTAETTRAWCHCGCSGTVLVVLEAVSARWPGVGLVSLGRTAHLTGVLVITVVGNPTRDGLARNGDRATSNDGLIGIGVHSRRLNFAGRLLWRFVPATIPVCMLNSRIHRRRRHLDV